MLQIAPMEVAALVVLVACSGALQAFARDGTFPGGQWVPAWLLWLFHVTTEDDGTRRFTLRRWAMAATVGLIPAWVFWACGVDAAAAPRLSALLSGWSPGSWLPPAIVWAGMGVAWTLGHSRYQCMGHGRDVFPDRASYAGSLVGMAATGGAMGVAPGLVLLLAGAWPMALGVVAGGSLKAAAYAIGWSLRPTPGGDPLWATQYGAILHGVFLFHGISIAGILVLLGI